jgi:hypothetical protein
MTKFDKTSFNYFGGYLTYGPDRKFIARFKHKGPFTKAIFLKELIKNHDVESYFAAMEYGKAPLQILKEANEAWWVATVEDYYGRTLSEIFPSRQKAA